jgi:transposase
MGMSSYTVISGLNPIKITDINIIRLTYNNIVYIIKLTYMKKTKEEDKKTEALREREALHPHPEAVKDEAFQNHEFFDSRDLVQVRYEMLRRHRVDAKPVKEVAASFGLSRQAFYETEAAFEAQGIAGLLPHHRGPKRAHKCTDEVLDFVETWRETAPPHERADEAVYQRFGIRINPRSIDRALIRRKKKRHTPGKR